MWLRTTVTCHNLLRHVAFPEVSDSHCLSLSSLTAVLFQEAIECVREMRSPGMMNVFVRESVNHTLEKSTLARVCVGQLFSELSKRQLLTEQKFIAG